MNFDLIIFFSLIGATFFIHMTCRSTLSLKGKVERGEREREKNIPNDFFFLVVVGQAGPSKKKVDGNIKIICGGT